MEFRQVQRLEILSSDGAAVGRRPSVAQLDYSLSLQVTGAGCDTHGVDGNPVPGKGGVEPAVRDADPGGGDVAAHPGQVKAAIDDGLRGGSAEGEIEGDLSRGVLDEPGKKGGDKPQFLHRAGGMRPNGNILRFAKGDRGGEGKDHRCASLSPFPQLQDQPAANAVVPPASRGVQCPDGGRYAVAGLLYCPKAIIHRRLHEHVEPAAGKKPRRHPSPEPAAEGHGCGEPRFEQCKIDPVPSKIRFARGRHGKGRRRGGGNFPCDRSKVTKVQLQIPGKAGFEPVDVEGDRAHDDAAVFYGDVTCCGDVPRECEPVAGRAGHRHRPRRTAIQTDSLHPRICPGEGQIAPLGQNGPPQRFQPGIGGNGETLADSSLQDQVRDGHPCRGNGYRGRRCRLPCTSPVVSRQLGDDTLPLLAVIPTLNADTSRSLRRCHRCRHPVFASGACQVK